MVVQWLRIGLATQGMPVPPLAGELRSHMPWGKQLESPHAPTTEPTRCGALVPQLEKPAHCNEEPVHRNERSRVPQLRPHAANQSISIFV